jgi:CHAD domain-containing protein
MEVESKFSLPDSSVLHHFQVTTRLAGFSLGKGQTRLVHDTYVDTAGRQILAGGYAFRFRQQSDGIEATLKGLGGVTGAIHTRAEVSCLLSAILPPEDWPEGPLREQVLQFTAGETLIPLVELHQTRLVRPVRKQGQAIAEMYLDDVHVNAGGREQAYYELEVELTPQGNENDLASISICLEEKWSLLPEKLSKFERALALFDVKPGMEPLYEQATLARISERADWHGLRARALLALQQGFPNQEVSRQINRSERTIRRWLAAFHHQGLEIFPRFLWEEPAPSLSLGDGEPPDGSQLAVLEPVTQPALPKIKILEKPGLVPDDVMAEAARKTFVFHFHQMLLHEPGTRSGEDIEELHDMRVATRRMRAALLVFGDYLDQEKYSPFGKALRRTGRFLGEVRDLDVFWEKTHRYLDTLPPEHQDELVPLQVVWQGARDQARDKLLAYLNGAHYDNFKQSFGDFLDIHAVGALAPFSITGQPRPDSLRQVAPVILFQQLAAVRAYDQWVTGPNVPLARLHQLRIASKGLRYSLEFLEEVLGPEARLLIKEFKVLQDHLGDLQDAVVASNILRDFLTWGTWGHPQKKAALTLPDAPVVSPGVASYLAARQTELQQLPITFIPLWEHVHSLEFKQNFIAALAVL